MTNYIRINIYWVCEFINKTVIRVIIYTDCIAMQLVVFCRPQHQKLLVSLRRSNKTPETFFSPLKLQILHSSDSSCRIKRLLK